MEHRASAAGYDTLMAVTHRNYEKETKYLNMLTSGLVDGVILFTTFAQRPAQRSVRTIPYHSMRRDRGRLEHQLCQH